MATESSGSNPDFKTRIPGLVDDADIREALKVFLYGEPTVANSAAAAGELTATDGTDGLVGHLNSMRTSLTNASVLKSLYSGSPTKGIILASTGSNTPSAVTVGADATVLTADSSAAAGVAWKNPTDNLFPKSAGGSHPLTGSLNVAYANPKVILNDISSVGTAFAEFQDASTKKWEIGKDASNNLVVNNSAGTAVLTVTESTDKVSVSEQPASANDVATKTYVDQYGVPVGTVVTFAGSSAPTNWVLCYGQEVDRTGTYATLFAVIGTNYGTPSSGDKFKLPDLRGRTTAGVDNMGGSDAGRIPWQNDLGTVGTASKTVDSGVHEVTLSSAQSGLPAHSHTTGYQSHDHHHSGTTDEARPLTGHGYFTNVAWDSPGAIASFADNWNGYLPTHTHPFTTGNQSQNHNHVVYNNTAVNASSAHNNMQPTMLLNYIIKYA